MKTLFLNKQNNKNLIVFFAGWSFDENPFKFLSCNDNDVLFVYDYNDLSIADILKDFSMYKNKTLIAWSMGVFVANLYGDLFKDFDYKLAINGTICPISNEYGIPDKMFDLTLKHAQIGLSGKFYKNVFKTEEEFEKYNENPVKRTIENRVEELENLKTNILKNNNMASEIFDLAIISDFDKIIPPKNQTASHKKNNVPILNLPYGHSIFYNFSTWNEIIKCKQTVNI